MKQNLALLSACVALCAVGGSATAQLRVVSYNTATAGVNAGSTMPRQGMATVLEAIGNENVAGVSKPIDVLLLQEQAASASSTQALVNLLNGIYGSGIYQRATLDGNTWGAGRPGMIYNTQSVQLLQQTAVGNLSSNGAVRQSLRYRLRPIGYDRAAELYVYSSHYKAGGTSSDRSRRNVEAQAIRANADSLGQGVHVLYAGDFNIQSSTESMYGTLLGPGHGQAFDPVNRPGSWNNNSAFRVLHSQSPYDSSYNDSSLIGGGLDDRFDFQLITDELRDHEGLSYIPGSYHVFGNNGSHRLNDAVNDPSNHAQPQPVLDALARVSDHLPVVADYQLPATMSIALDTAPDRVLVGSAIPLALEVWNSAQVVAAHGADELDYEVSSAGALSGSFADSDAALGDVNRHILQLDASTLGPQVGLAIVNSGSQAVPHPTDSQSVNFTVVDHSNASFDGTADVDAWHVDFGILAPGTGLAARGLAVHNLFAATGFTAGLDLDAVQGFGDTHEMGIDLTEFENLAAGSSVTFDAQLDTSVSGTYASTWLLQLSDEDLPGVQLPSNLTLTLSGSVALPGDANLDGLVDASDFNIWNAHKFSDGSSWDTADFNFDGLTDGSDFNIWNSYKFSTLDDHRPTVAVPEPSAAWLLVWSCMVLLTPGGHRHFNGCPGSPTV